MDTWRHRITQLDEVCIKKAQAYVRITIHSQFMSQTFFRSLATDIQHMASIRSRFQQQ